MRSALPSVLILASLALTSCTLRSSWSGARFVGSGHRETQNRELSERVDRIVVQGSLDVSARAGEAPGIVVSGDHNLIDRVVTDVEGERLVVRLENGSYDFTEEMRVTVFLPELRELTIRGSGDADVEGLDGEHLELAIQGSGDVRARGFVRRLEASIHGSGDLELRELEVETANVRVKGSGDIRVTARDEVDAAVHGSGDVHVHGPCQVRARTFGSGDVKVHDGARSADHR